MREDIKKWIEALRSGEYKQTKGVLEFEGSYCCLGVYCKITGIEYNPGFENPEAVFGVDEANRPVYGKLRDIIYVEVFTDGVSMNDNGRSFSEIADMIEEFYEND